jgi:hypothetical protein
MLFCYPDEWRRQPMELQIQSLFSEDPLALRPGDEVPGRFAIAISTPGQKTYSLKEIVLMAKSADITVDEVSQELGVQVTVKTESLQVPLERVFTLLGAKGQDRRSQIYDLNSKYLDLMPGKTVREDTEIVDGIESLVVERTLPQEATEDLVQFFVITYLEKADLIFTFIFTDNIGDRDKIDTIRKKVLATVKYWKPSAPQQLPKSLAANSKPDAA